MATKTLISSPSFVSSSFTPISRPGLHRLPLFRPRKINTKVKSNLHDIPPLQPLDSVVDFHGLVSRAEGLLYTLADAASVAVDSSASAADEAQKNGGWFGFISNAMEVVLKVIGIFERFLLN